MVLLHHFVALTVSNKIPEVYQNRITGSAYTGCAKIKEGLKTKYLKLVSGTHALFIRL